MSSIEIGEFHSREGFYFKRDRYGNVRVRVTETARDGSPTAREVTLPPNEWASVIASMCARGEDGESYQDALDFHTVKDVPPPTAGLIRGNVPSPVLPAKSKGDGVRMEREDVMPVFVLKARDNLAPGAVENYAAQCARAGLQGQAAEVRKALTEIRAWRDRHPDECKLPDHDHRPAGSPGSGSESCAPSPEAGE